MSGIQCLVINAGDVFNVVLYWQVVLNARQAAFKLGRFLEAGANLQQHDTIMKLLLYM